MKQIISLSIVSIAFHTAEMRRMNRALVNWKFEHYWSNSRSGQFSERAAVRFEEQIMSKDKYLSIFSHQMEAFVFIILLIF